jgi:23S rRNA pseudouridine2604 synthase
MQLRIQRLLCKHYRISYTEAMERLARGEVKINEEVAQVNQRVYKTDKVECGAETIQEAPEFQYIAMYKPRGIECTENTDIPSHLFTILPEAYHSLYTVGRLDKDTEGLLFLTNNSRFYDAIADSSSICEKEYRVTVEQVLTEEALQTMSSGMVIMGQRTRPCIVERKSDHVFHITLTQGLNRQIRRICYKLGYDIVELKRIRISSIQLGDLTIENPFRDLTSEEVHGILTK